MNQLKMDEYILLSQKTIFDISNCTDVEYMNHDENIFLINIIYFISITLTAFHFQNKYYISPYLYGILRFLPCFIIIPLILMCFMILSIYRKLVEFFISKRHNYVGFLKEMDAYWALDDGISKSIINILLTIEIKDEDPVELFKRVVQDRLLITGTKKLSCKIKWTKYGYCYWEKTTVDLNKQIRKSDFTQLEKKLCQISNTNLPNGYLWEIIIGEKPIKNSYNVLFRVHHCIGDGFSLIKNFLYAMIDVQSTKKLIRVESNKSFFKERKSIFDMFLALLYTREILIKQIFSQPDLNKIHGNQLSGDKFIFWKSYSVNKIKTIKKKLKSSFTGVLLYAVTKGLQHNIEANEATLIIPAKIGNDDFASDGFTLMLLKLPIRGKNHFEKIKQKTQILNTLPDLLVNYWLLKLGFTLLPLGLFGNISSKHASYVFSNVPGPCKSTIYGNKVQDIKFWVPHRDKTGVGISILSYGDNLNIGISADKSCIQNSYQVEALLDRIVTNLDDLYVKIM